MNIEDIKKTHIDYINGLYINENQAMVIIVASSSMKGAIISSIGNAIALEPLLFNITRNLSELHRSSMISSSCALLIGEMYEQDMIKNDDVHTIAKVISAVSELYPPFSEEKLSITKAGDTPDIIAWIKQLYM